ncbi:30S ribosomal protein S27e [Candidatus Pacearchaeota archaeon]|nr:30S ribosomal protein S27e [Candidatus Pacearchaeota archaeon]
MVNDPESKFVRAVCTRCGNSQVLFGKSSTRVKCDKCNKLLVEPKGGKTRIRTMVKEVFTEDGLKKI